MNMQYYLLSICALLILIQSGQMLDIEVSFKTPYCIKDSLYYALEAQYFQNKEDFWASVLNFQSREDYFNQNQLQKYYFNPDDQTKLEYYNQLEKQQSMLYGTENCPIWIKSIIYQDNSDQIQTQKQFSVFCGLDQYLHSEQLLLPDEMLKESIDFRKDKILFSNLNDPEILIVYMDLKQVDAIEIFNKLSHKNIILRYKFTECFSMNEHHIDIPHYKTNDTENFQGIAIDIKVYKYPKSPGDLMVTFLRYKQTIYKNRLHVLFDPYQQYILNLTRYSNEIREIAWILENHPSFIIDLNYTDPIEQALNFTGIVTKEQFFIVNHKCVRLNRHSSDPIYMNLQIIQAFKESIIFSEYVQNPQQLYQNILLIDHKKPVFRPKFLLEEQNSYLTLRKNKNRLDLSKFNQLIQQISKQGNYSNIKVQPGLMQVLLILDLSHSQDQYHFLRSLAEINKNHIEFEMRLIIVNSKSDDETQIGYVYKCLTTLFEKELNYEFLPELFKEDPIEFCRVQQNNIDNQNDDKIKKLKILKSHDLCQDNSICEFPFMMINQNVINQQQLLKAIALNKEQQGNIIDLLKSIMIDQLIKLKIPENLINTQTSNLFDIYLRQLSIYKYQTEHYQGDIRNQYLQQDSNSIAKLKILDFPDTITQQSLVIIHVQSQDIEFLENIKEWVNQLNSVKQQIILEIVENFNNHLIIGQLSLGQKTYLFVNGLNVDIFGMNKYRFFRLIQNEKNHLNLLLERVQLKDNLQKLKLINEIRITEYVKVNASISDDFNCLQEFNVAQNKTISLRKLKTVPNPILSFKAKVNVMTREAVNFISLINQLGLGLKIELALFTQRSVGIEMKYLPYNFFRLFFKDQQSNTQSKGQYKITNLSRKYDSYFIDIVQSRRQIFITNELSPFYELEDYGDDLQKMQNIQSNSLFGKSGYSLVFSLSQLRKLNPSERNPHIQFYQKRVNQLIKIGEVNSNPFNPLSRNLMNKKERFMLIDGSGKAIQTFYSILHQYLQLILHSPGRYFLMRENTQEIIQLDYSSVIESDGQLDEFEFQSGYDSVIFRSSELDSFKSNYNFQNLNLRKKNETVNMYYTASGSLFEKLVLYQIKQNLEDYSQYNFRFLIWEGTFSSPSLKLALAKLATIYDFEMEYINYPWPHDVAFQDQNYKRIILLYRILFLDNSIPHHLDRIVYRDADQCSLFNSDMKELQNTDIKGFPQAMVPHCRFFDNKGWDENKVMKDLPNDLLYFTNNVLLIDAKKYRESDYPDKLLDYYQAAIGKWGFDPFLLSQDFQNPAQVVAPIFPLDEDWEWAEDFCDPEKKKTAKIIDFQDIKREDKLSIAKRVCPNFTFNFVALLEFLRN
ncbi:udp-glucose:glycoprotein glucosyltransferase [Stylonychia lemnae]|uniref:Udp-glucose:glycoprotein glucosyltransferase n=1 Tax=Stylonychia lemnae TaxID=5949 RepID=A0A078AF13_STYLE|nr:udp-glucose:glycoprotein glucosyltransferase [Stylonychia lemnae]|eukprot:CDW80810.1 udp-glucose:glycoprotein glucosyltransferase [Stylonychia lemnae]